MRPPVLNSATKVYIAGHRGLVGSALVRALRRRGLPDPVVATSAELDLRDRAATARFLARESPDVVVLAAARVGGIAANAAQPAEFLSDNLRIQLAVLDAARAQGVPRVLFLGSSCIYPKLAPQPIREDALLTGPLEPTNSAYAIAKIAGIEHVRAVRAQDGLPWISAMPTNLYGPGDNFHPTASHVLPGLLRRFHEARESGAASVVVWGTGTPRREFLHADDAAEACLHLLEHFDGPDPVNVGTGTDVTIAELAGLVAEVVGFTGRVEFDTSKPDGTPRKVLDVGVLRGLGWAPRTGLREGLESTYRWYLESLALPEQRAVRGLEVAQ
ncbi:GDP-L-fucose synthase family protein [Actinokineospora bangkokensis]|uniref:GDP-L-fucose synthase n=1 Tax=Actinokineospora bangkokensis TaxID=1193682 RepID=A0A1Q9LJA6_9PSEU|nr:GDP-L-fucose synthase [Actinokineospora bangkokensis]OLR92116.1 GDP-fucose synthetase [Actinokineospora bangkokensis]